jgi:hypothetical protein
VQDFWQVRASQLLRQQESGKVDAGTRGAVTGGAQMGAVTHLIVDLLIEAGLSKPQIYTSSCLELPGYYRPEKRWDLLVVSEGVLIAAVELKSQVGPSFGNNFNNRTEEAIGSATCLWTAYREGRFGKQNRPFVGYLFLLEDCPQVRRPVSVKEPHFQVEEVFVDASYQQRYEIFCRRLVRERLYDAACFAVATNASPSTVSHPAEDLTFERFAVELQGRVRTFLQARS